jgi:hydrogenase nickel incorporation protein HypA/HybF
MHELSIAMSLIEEAAEEAQRQGGARVSAVHLRLGRLSGVAKDALLFSYELACEGTPLEGSRLVIEDVAVTAFCPCCEIERALPSIQQMCCPVCGALIPQVAQGREIELVALEIEI